MHNSGRNPVEPGFEFGFLDGLRGSHFNPAERKKALSLMNDESFIIAEKTRLCRVSD